MTQQLLLGFLLALIVSAAARAARSLSNTGAAAAALLGTVIFGLGGLPWAVLLLGFFISSSVLSHVAGKRKKSLNEKFSKGSQRDAGQVLANGGTAGIFVLLHLIFPAEIWPWIGCAGTLDAVNADTWATELGVLSKAEPRLITTGKTVERGTSGGVTLAGTLAATGGAAFIALLAILVWPGGISFLPLLLALLIITLAGLAASLVDSLLGATLQAIYYCPACNKETERHPLHTCGQATQQVHGLTWMNNDWVNTLCALAGGLLAALGSSIFF